MAEDRPGDELMIGRAREAGEPSMHGATISATQAYADSNGILGVCAESLWCIGSHCEDS